MCAKPFVFLSPFTSSLPISVLPFPRPFSCLPLFVNLWVHCSSCQLLCTVHSRVLQWSSVVPVPASVSFQTSHQSTHIQWRPQPQTNKVRFNTGNINLCFNTSKLKPVYRQTISYNKICSSLKFSFLSLLMSVANWLGNQQLAMSTRLMHLHFQYCFRVQFLALHTTSASRHGYMF